MAIVRTGCISIAWKGGTRGCPAKRAYVVEFLDAGMPESVEVNGEALP